jgi:L-alanine-DL-glutamate epimerase-like enolase superfamily enzyme
VTNRPEVIDGTLALPDGPGLGWELDDDYIDRYRQDRA